MERAERRVTDFWAALSVSAGVEGVSGGGRGRGVGASGCRHNAHVGKPINHLDAGGNAYLAASSVPVWVKEVGHAASCSFMCSMPPAPLSITGQQSGIYLSQVCPGVRGAGADKADP